MVSPNSWYIATHLDRLNSNLLADTYAKQEIESGKNNSESNPKDETDNSDVAKAKKPGTLVKDIMSKQVIVVPTTTTVYQVSKIMQQGIGSVLIKLNAALVGIITSRDFAVKVVANNYSPNTQVGRIGSVPLHTIDQDESIFEAARIMTSQKIHKLAVLNNDKVVGIITPKEFVNVLSRIEK